MPSKLQVVPFGEITCALLAAFCPLVGCSPPDQLTNENNPSLSVAADTAGRYIVVLKADVTSPDVRAQELASTYARRTRHFYHSVFKGFAADLDAPAVASLKQQPEVLRVIPEVPVTAHTIDATAGWGLGRIDQRSGPSNYQFSYTSAGAGVHVYVLGNGVQAGNPDFGGRVVAAWTYDANYPAGLPCHNHENAIASVAAGAEYGVAKSATIYSVRFNDCDGVAGHGDIVAAIDWVTTNHINPAVMNLSWGLPSWLDGFLAGSVHHAAIAAKNSGVFVVVSAGNDNTDACSQSPADALELMTVGATDAADARAPFSNYGGCVDIFAPGSYIDVANYLAYPAFITDNGTSIAAPFVAGVAAALYAVYPNDTPDNIHYAIRDGATVGAISNPGPSSPNRLLYSVLPVPVSVTISGPTSIGRYASCTWTAVKTGGRAPFTHIWSGLFTGAGASVSGNPVSSGFLNVQVTDALGGVANASIYVTEIGNSIFCS